MPELPTREILGPRPSLRSGRRTARIQRSVPTPAPMPAVADTSSIGRGITNLGRGVSSLGDAAAALEARQLKEQEFETERRFQEFKWEQERALDRRMRGASKTDLPNFAGNWHEGYRTGEGRAFFESVPEPLKSQFDFKLRQFGVERYREAEEFEVAERERLARLSIVDMSEQVWRPKARVTPTEELDDLAGEAAILIDSMPYLTPSEAEEAKQSIYRDIGLSHLDAQPADRIDELAGPEAMLSGTLPTPLMALTDEDRQKVFDKRRREIAALTKDVEANLKEGLLPSQSVIDTLAAAGADRTVAMIEATASVRQMRPEQLATLAQDIRAQLAQEGVTDQRQVDQLEVIEALQTHMEKALTDDPLGFAASAGVIDDLPQINPTSEGFAGQFQDRAVVAEQVAEYYGREPVYLRPDERAMFIDAVERAENPLQKMAAIEALSAAAGEKAPAVFAELGESTKDRALGPTIAHIGGLVTLGSRGVALDALSGLEIKKADMPQMAGSPQEKLETWSLEIEGALSGMTPETGQALFETVDAAYVARATRRGAVEFDEELYLETLNEVFGGRLVERRVPSGGLRTETVGGLGSWQGEAIILPSDVSQNSLDDMMDRMRDIDLAAFSVFGGAPEHLDGQPATVDEIRDGYLVWSGGNSYRISLGEPGTMPQYLIDGETGQDYAIRVDAAAVASVVNRTLTIEEIQAQLPL